ncbi:MAG TPA: hypothetical protein VIK27_03995 [Candidatus Aquilonibacter sp.]
MKIAPSLLACLLVALPATALADSHGGGNHDGSRQPQQAPHAQQQRAPQQRYQQQRAPQRRYQQQPAPQQRYQQQRAPQQRYQQQPAPQQRYQQQPAQQRYEQQRAPQRYQQPAQRYDQRTVTRNVQPMPRYVARGSYGGGRLENPRGWTQAWQWNGGRQWVGDNDYWGGGFWGALTINLGGGGYGGYAYDNYAVQQNSPGAQLLAQYGLTETDCNQPNLVQIDGPDGSEICAYPNDEVAPGQYQVDPATLSLVSY